MRRIEKKRKEKTRQDKTRQDKTRKEKKRKEKKRKWRRSMTTLKVACSWAGAVVRKPLATRKSYQPTNQQTE